MIWHPGIDPWLETFYCTIENCSKYKYISTYAFAGFTCGVAMLLETAGKISLASKQTRSFPSRCQSDPYMKEFFFHTVRLTESIHLNLMNSIEFLL